MPVFLTKDMNSSIYIRIYRYTAFACYTYTNKKENAKTLELILTWRHYDEKNINCFAAGYCRHWRTCF